MSNNQVINLKDGVAFCVSVINPRLLLATPAFKEYEVEDEEGNLIGLNCLDQFKINKGESIQFKNQKYKIQTIEKQVSKQGKTTGYYLYTHKDLTKTCNFIVPLLGYNRVYWRWSLNFVNAFCGTQMYADYGNSIYMLYRYQGDKIFGEFEQNLQNHPWFSESIDTDHYHVMFKFDIPEEWQEDVDLILKGKYSRISVKLKEKILKFHGSSETRPLGQILSKSPVRRKQLEKELGTSIPKNLDLLDPFKTEEEIFMNYLIIEETSEEGSEFQESTF